MAPNLHLNLHLFVYTDLVYTESRLAGRSVSQDIPEWNILYPYMTRVYHTFRQLRIEVDGYRERC